MMSTHLKPWMKATFELIVHAEIHLREGGDFDRRIAHVGFDNAIEVAITTYLGLNPIQRNGKQYSRDDVDRWLKNYHTKLEFLEAEARARGKSLRVPNDEIVYFHEIRNSQYHAGGPGIPEAEHLELIRKAALDVFAMLFDVNNMDSVLEESLDQRTIRENEPRPRNPTVDRLIDITGEPVNILGVPYAVSEVLYGTDPESYHAIAAAVSESRNVLSELSTKFPGQIRSEISHIGFVHYEEEVYLKTLNTNGEISLTDTDFISGADGRFFTPRRDPDDNADRLVMDFDPYSIINCFALFTKRAARKVARKFEAARSRKSPSFVPGAIAETRK